MTAKGLLSTEALLKAEALITLKAMETALPIRSVQRI